MPYVEQPIWARRLLHMLRALLYGICLVMGIGAVWLTPQSVSIRLPGTLTDIWGMLAVAGAVGCLCGALMRRYRWELTSLPLLIGAVVIFAWTIWDAVADTPTRTAQAAAVTSLLLALAIRYVDLLVVRSRLRQQHDRRIKG